jgi:diadenosine tetraphosphatase ApaH/serine/threonine PP2A family protein phosphatase
MALVHASPDDCWRSPIADASADELQNVYGALNQPVVVYGHIHVPFVRGIGALTVANSGSVGQPLDGDRGASYLLLDKSDPNIRRVEYDVGMEVRRLRESGLPHAEWLVKMLESARPAGME